MNEVIEKIVYGIKGFKLEFELDYDYDNLIKTIKKLTYSDYGIKSLGINLVSKIIKGKKDTHLVNLINSDFVHKKLKTILVKKLFGILFLKSIHAYSSRKGRIAVSLEFGGYDFERLVTVVNAKLKYCGNRYMQCVVFSVYEAFKHLLNKENIDGVIIKGINNVNRYSGELCVVLGNVAKELYEMDIKLISLEIQALSD